MKITDMMYVKSSGEMGMVMEITSDLKPPEGFSPQCVKLKIPKATHDKGIIYAYEVFYPEELETHTQRLDREEREFNELTNSRKGKASDAIDLIFGAPSLKTN